MTTRRRNLFSLWCQAELDWVSIACFKSAVRAGHAVDLYSYSDVVNLPEGVTLRDANEVIPENEIFRYNGIAQPQRFGSLGPFSDAFRYRALSHGRGVWMDSDVYFLKPVDTDQETILAWEKPNPLNGKKIKPNHYIGNALMCLPSNGGALRDLVRLTSKPYPVPPWIPAKRLELIKAKLNGSPIFPGAFTYATVGPVALTYYADQHDLLEQVKDYEVYYPISFENMDAYAQDLEVFEATLPSSTEVIHLWNSLFSNHFEQNLPRGSFAERVREESLNG